MIKHSRVGGQYTKLVNRETVITLEAERADMLVALRITWISEDQYISTY